MRYRAVAASILAASLFAGLAAANEADALSSELDQAFAQSDFAKAQIIQSELEKRGIRTWFNPQSLTACLQAGKTIVSAKEHKAIAADPRNTENFIPDDELKAAVAFANGWGVPQNRQRAIALVCRSNELTRAEWDDSVSFLSTPANAAKPYLFCDHVTSGLHGGQCTGFVEDRKQTARDRQLRKLEAMLTPAQKLVFAKLKTAAESYIQSHSSDEQDMSGTARGTFYSEEVGRLHGQFLSDLEAFEQGQRPPQNDFAAADKTLNETYHTIITKTDWRYTGTIKLEGVRDTERYWLTLRDTWAIFGPLRFPGTAADDWKAWATRRRIEDLKACFPLQQ